MGLTRARGLGMGSGCLRSGRIRRSGEREREEGLAVRQNFYSCRLLYVFKLTLGLGSLQPRRHFSSSPRSRGMSYSLSLSLFYLRFCYSDSLRYAFRDVGNKFINKRAAKIFVHSAAVERASAEIEAPKISVVEDETRLFEETHGSLCEREDRNSYSLANSFIHPYRLSLRDKINRTVIKSDNAIFLSRNSMINKVVTESLSNLKK